MSDRNRKESTMKVKLIVGLVVLLGSQVGAGASYPETREYLLGDIDGFVYNGSGSVDDVYVDPDLWADTENPTWPIIPFDYFRPNSLTPFSFTYLLAENEAVIAANLTIAMKASDSLVSTDRIFLFDSDVTYTVDWFFDVINWHPISATETTVRSLNIGNILGTDHLWLLQDGVFNVRVQDDTAIDYAILSIEVVPEPATLSLLVIGGLAMLRRGRK